MSDGELRCFCRYRSLLATHGVDNNGQVFLYVKVYKAGKIYGEIVITDGGTVRLRCRSCHRWHRVFMRSDQAPVMDLDRSVSGTFPNG